MPESKHCDPPTHEDFHIAIICALPTEANPVTVLLDREYETCGSIYMKSVSDANTYTTGRLGTHDVVVVHMPGPGITNAAGVPTQLKSTFKNISVCLVVGICGGVPAPLNRANIFCGDVIIATAVVQMDMGRQYPDRFRWKTGVEDSLGRGSPEIRAFLGKLQSENVHERLRQKTEDTMAELVSNAHYSKARYPRRDKIVLYPADYRHKHRDRPCEICDRCETQCDPVCEVALQSSCDELGCKASWPGTWHGTARSSTVRGDEEGIYAHNIRQDLQRINIHFGCIASSNQVMKSGQHRDEIAKTEGVIGFEMESAGIWEVMPTIVVKAVADYADSHKSKDWQPYSAAVAAACAKAILAEWRDTDNASDGKRDERSLIVSPRRVERLNQEVGRQTINGNVFFGPIHYCRQVGAFDDVIHKGAEAIKRSNQSLEHSQEHREAQSNYIDSLMEAVTAAGELLFKLLLGGPISYRIHALAGNYFGKLAITQDALATQIRETDTISEDLQASNDEIKDAMVDVDLKLDELYVLLFEQDYPTGNLSIADAAPDILQSPCEQEMEESDAGKTGSERLTSQEGNALIDQGKKFEPPSGPTSSPDALPSQQTKNNQHLQKQLAILEGQKCQLHAQLDLIGSEFKAQRTALEISEARIRDLEARERKAEEERERQRSRWCIIL